MSDVQARAGRVYRAPREWTRVHPVSPFLGAWPLVGAVLFYLVISRAPDWVAGDDGVTEAISATHISVILIAAVLFGIVLLIAGGGYVAWRFNEYRIGDDAVYQRKGVLFRQQRQARLDRLQAVDVVQPLLARLTGFGAIRIEVAGGENSGIALEYLRIGDAEALRNEIVELAAGYKRRGADSDPTPPTDSSQADAADASAGALQGDNIVFGGLRQSAAGDRTDRPAAAERPMYKVPNGRLIASIALSWPTFWLVLTPVWVVALMIIFRVDIGDVLSAVVGTSLVTAVPVIAGLFGYFWTKLNRGFGFTAGVSQDGIRLRHGLLETRRQTVPPGRVQAVQLRQSWWWRRSGWWEVTINVAGYQDDQGAVSTLLPVGSEAEALEAIWLVLPDLGLVGADGASADSPILAAMSGTGGDHGFTASPARARAYDLLQWRQRGVRATESALLIRSGRFVREVSIVPHARTQSLALQQGPLQRALGLATVEVHSTNGPVKPVAKHLGVDDAIALLDAQAERAREGRRHQTPEQWMKAVGLDA
ncbi:PH domain-containing protein [Demequina aurantiaca]|uniref:PH domain-containing protein n=1 Tax=Demequina aurantiaca TaxID=676200 RepID=UPI003D34D518